MEVGHITIYSDCQLVVNQVKEDFKVREEKMQEYLAMVQTLLKKFHHFQIQQVQREDNVIVDALTKFSSSSDIPPSPTVKGHQFEPSRLKTDIGHINCEFIDDDWMTPI